MINNNKQKNNIKFYVTDEVLEILFNFLKEKTTKQELTKTNQELTKTNIEWLQQEIDDRTIDKNTNEAKNKVNTPHTEEYFKPIKEKINKLSKFASKEFEKLKNDELKVLAEFLYQLEDLAEDKKFFPEKSKKQDECHQSSSVITQLHIIKTLALPVLENCTYKYDKNKQTNIHLVQDFNFLQKSSSAYKFYNFYPFNDKTKFQTEEDALKFHYKTMAENYFTYLKGLIDANPNTFFVCYKPGVKNFADDCKTATNHILKIFNKAFNKLDNEYKQHIMFCVSSTDISTNENVGYKYDYTLDELRKKYPNNEFLKKANNIQYINGVARDAWGKIGDEGRFKSYKSTDAKFYFYSNEPDILYAGNKKTFNKFNKDETKDLSAGTAEIHINNDNDKQHNDTIVQDNAKNKNDNDKKDNIIKNIVPQPNANNKNDNDKKDNIIKNIVPQQQITQIGLSEFFSQIETMIPKSINIEINDIQKAKQIINEKCRVGFFESIFCCCSTDVCKRKKRKEELLKAIDRIQKNTKTNQTPIISLNMQQIQQLSGRE